MDSAVHTCSYSCERPACIKAQRDELTAHILTQPAHAVDLAPFRLLAAEYSKIGNTFRAEDIRNGRVNSDEHLAINAIRAALHSTAAAESSGAA